MRSPMRTDAGHVRLSHRQHPNLDSRLIHGAALHRMHTRARSYCSPRSAAHQLPCPHVACARARDPADAKSQSSGLNDRSSDNDAVVRHARRARDAGRRCGGDGGQRGGRARRVSAAGSPPRCLKNGCADHLCTAVGTSSAGRSGGNNNDVLDVRVRCRDAGRPGPRRLPYAVQGARGSHDRSEVALLGPGSRGRVSRPRCRAAGGPTASRHGCVASVPPAPTSRVLPPARSHSEGHGLHAVDAGARVRLRVLGARHDDGPLQGR